MIVKVHLDGARILRECQVVQVDCDPSTSLSNLIMEIKACFHPDYELDLSRYYTQPKASTILTSLPFIISDGRALWAVPLDQVTLSSFFQTHGITDATIHLSIPMCAGGVGASEIVHAWQMLFPIADQVVTGAGLIGLALGAAKWVRGRLHQPKELPDNLQAVHPNHFISLVLSRERWNAFDLAELVQVDRDCAAHWLKALRYKWDRTRIMYVRTEATDALVKQFENALIRNSTTPGRE